MALAEEGEKAPADNCYRLVVLGSSKVGKTAIVNRFLHNKFNESYTPTIEDFHRKVYRIKGEAYRLDILDTSGNNPFPAMRKLCLMTGDLFILVFSYDNPESFTEVQTLRQQIINSKSQLATEQKKRQKKFSATPVVIVGNKLDLKDKAVDIKNVLQYLDGEPDCQFVDASAKKDINIDEVFVKLFNQAKLPTEMSPALHRKVQPNYVGSGGKNSRASIINIRRKMSDACGTVSPNPRRPSIRTDLLIINTRKSMDMKAKSQKKCIIM